MDLLIIHFIFLLPIIAAVWFIIMLIIYLKTDDSSAKKRRRGIFVLVSGIVIGILASGTLVHISVITIGSQAYGLLLFSLLPIAVMIGFVLSLVRYIKMKNDERKRKFGVAAVILGVILATMVFAVNGSFALLLLGVINAM